MSCVYFLISNSAFQYRCLLFWRVLRARLSDMLLLSVKMIFYYSLFSHDNFKIQLDIGISLLLVLYEISFPELLQDMVEGSYYNFTEISLVFQEYSEIWWLAFQDRGFVLLSNLYLDLSFVTFLLNFDSPPSSFFKVQGSYLKGSPNGLVLNVQRT